MSFEEQLPEQGFDLASAHFDAQLAQLGTWAKEGWHWEDIEQRVYDLFNVTPDPPS